MRSTWAFWGPMAMMSDRLSSMPEKAAVMVCSGIFGFYARLKSHHLAFS
jgi:hypothetical protein